MWKLKLFLAFFLLTFNEVLIYRVQRFKWTKINCLNVEHCTRILFVADPQILGNVNERFYARLDNDRHLALNYKAAVKFVKPNVIIFLGDLMDEGSIASDRQYLDYYGRFLKLFPVPEHINAIYVPGDNDIGGEGGERIDSTRFNAVFSNKTFWNLQDEIEIFHVNGIEKKFPKMPEKESNATRIVISHYELMNNRSYREILEEIKPKIIFSAHNHKSTINVGQIGNTKSREMTELISLNLNNLAKMIEIQIPTASYRMGTLTIGFGQAVIENEIFNYSPIFVISRFYQFLIYFIGLKVFAISACCHRCVSYVKRKRAISRYQQLNELE